MEKFLKWWKRYSFVLLIAFVLAGIIDIRFATAAVICMVAPIIVSVFNGRFWCGNLCPRGNFYDNAVSRFSNKRKVPDYLKSGYFRFIFTVLVLWVFALGVKNNWGNIYGIGMVFYRIIVLSTLAGILLSLLYNHRTWCHFCPMGSIASFISRISIEKKVLHVSSDCTSCKICEKKCSLGIVPYEYKGDLLSHPDCIQCGKCAAACPKKAIRYN